jgi:hypothetical protein
MDLQTVEAILSKRGVQPHRRLRAARHLQITQIRFSGTKAGKVVGDFDFDWQIGSGIWALTSFDNLVGKSSVIEILLWALRGEPKALQDDVRRWLSHVNIRFLVDSRLYEIDFHVDEGRPRGALHEVKHGIPESIDRFESDEAFAAVVSDFMMDSLSLEPIPGFQGSDEDGYAVNHGWNALSGVMYVGGDHKLLIGDVVWSGLPGRLLQMYVGLPWSRTLMLARTAKKVVASEVARMKKESDAIVQRYSARREALQKELTETRRRLASFESEAVAARNAASLAEQIPQLLTELDAVTQDIQKFREEEMFLLRIADADERAVRDLREDLAAASFFNGLKPAHCPRCETPITPERLTSESQSKHCSVCTTSIQTADVENSALEDAESRRDASKAALTRPQELLVPLVKTQEQVTASLNLARSAAHSIANRMGITESRTLELDVARIEGALSTMTESASVSPGTSPDARVLDAAAEEANSRVNEAQRGLLDEFNKEIVQLAKRFGIVSLESVQLDLQARMKVVKGAEETWFSRLTTGERLRLRIATAIALLRVGALKEVGRHPGLLIIDSPASEETTEHNLDTLLEELNQICKEMQNLQIIIATARPKDVLSTIETGRVRVANPGNYLW